MSTSFLFDDNYRMIEYILKWECDLNCNEGIAPFARCIGMTIPGT
jgi:hypothetical protein